MKINKFMISLVFGLISTSGSYGHDDAKLQEGTDVYKGTILTVVTWGESKYPGECMAEPWYCLAGGCDVSKERESQLACCKKLAKESDEYTGDDVHLNIKKSGNKCGGAGSPTHIHFSNE